MRSLALLVLAFVAAAACAVSSSDARDGWTGTIDTLPTGQIVVRNPAEPLWRPGEEWRVVEELRVGRVMGEGPDVFGRIEAFEVDGAGRIWVLDAQAREVRVFDSLGAHVRTLGRRGAGPGEFEMPVDIEAAPYGRIQVVDVGINRISAFDTAGRYVAARHLPKSFQMTPWPGRYDREGRYYAPVWATPTRTEQVAFTFERYDTAFVAEITLERPIDPIDRAVVTEQGTIGRVPLQGALVWHVSDRGTILAIVTHPFRLFELSPAGDTVRTIDRPLKPVPVTEADRDRLRSRWPVSGGEPVEPSWWSRLPRTKPAVTSFFFEDESGGLWVGREADPDEPRRVFDVHDPDGRWLGSVRLSFPLQSPPIIRDARLWAVTTDSLGVQYAVRARIERR